MQTSGSIKPVRQARCGGTRRQAPDAAGLCSACGRPRPPRLDVLPTHVVNAQEGASGSPPSRCESSNTTATKENRMRTHANPPLSLEGRRRLVELILKWRLNPLGSEGAGRLASDHPSLDHPLECGGRRSTACSFSASRIAPAGPIASPKRTDAALEQLILDLSARTNLGPARLSHIVNMPPATISKVLKRHGKSRGACTPRPITRRYAWAEPGALIHLDTAKLARFQHPGHRTRGRSTETHLRKDRGMGHVGGACGIRRSLQIRLRRATHQ